MLRNDFCRSMIQFFCDLCDHKNRLFVSTIKKEKINEDEKNENNEQNRHMIQTSTEQTRRHKEASQEPTNGNRSSEPKNSEK